MPPLRHHQFAYPLLGLFLSTLFSFMHPSIHISFLPSFFVQRLSLPFTLFLSVYTSLLHLRFFTSVFFPSSYQSFPDNFLLTFFSWLISPFFLLFFPCPLLRFVHFISSFLEHLRNMLYYLNITISKSHTQYNTFPEYTGCFTTSGRNCRRWFPRFLWSKRFI